MILIAPVLKIPESFKWRARLSNQLRTLLHSIFFLNIGRPEDILNVLTASRWGIVIVWEKTFNRVVKGWFIIFDNYPISMINTMNWLQTTFFSFCHKWFFPQFSNLHIRLIKLAKNHFSYQLKITYYLRNTCCFVHKIDFNSSMIHRHLLKRSLFYNTMKNI